MNRNMPKKIQIIPISIVMVSFLLNPGILLAQKTPGTQTSQMEINQVEREIERLERSISDQEKAIQPVAKTESWENNGLIIDVLEVQDVGINEVLEMIRLKTGARIEAPRDLDGRVTIYLKDVYVDDALRIVLDTHNLAYVKRKNTYRIMTAEEFFKTHGYAFGEKIQTRVVPLIHVRPGNIEDFLYELKSDRGRVVYTEESRSFIITDSPKKIQMMEEFIKARDVVTREEVFTLRYVNPADIISSVRAVVSPAGESSLKVDQVNNTITVKDTEAKIDEVRVLIESLDVQEFDIVLDIKVIQITLHDEHLDGVDWEAIVSGYESLKIEDMEEYAKGGVRDLSLGTVSQEDFQVLLEALDTVGFVNEIMVETIIAEENDEASITVNYAADPDAKKLAEKIKYYLRPKILIEDEVDMRIRPEFTFHDKYEFERRFTTAKKINVETQSTIVVGGLFKDIKVEQLWKIPLLGDIPFLGFAFRNQYSKIRKSEIILFITPKLIEKNS